MPNGPLEWTGDHFTHAELAQLRETCENEALAWLHTRLTNTSSNTSASVVVLVIPEDSIKAGLLLNLDRVNSLEPPLGGTSGSDGRDVGGRYFLTSDPVGRVKVFFNGVIVGISHLNNLVDANQQVDLGILQSALEQSVQDYRKAQRNDLGLGDRAWLSVSLLDTHNLGAHYRQNSLSNVQYLPQRVATTQVTVPEIMLDQSQQVPSLEDGIRSIFRVIYSAFGA